ARGSARDAVAPGRALLLCGRSAELLSLVRGNRAYSPSSCLHLPSRESPPSSRISLALAASHLYFFRFLASVALFMRVCSSLCFSLFSSLCAYRLPMDTLALDDVPRDRCV